jgi:hypothetical protein
MTINVTGGLTVTLVIPAMDAIKLQLDELKGVIMALDAKTEALRAQMDAATTAIGVKIQALIDQAKTQGSMTAAEIDAAFQPIADTLTALAAPGTV